MIEKNKKVNNFSMKKFIILLFLFIFLVSFSYTKSKSFLIENLLFYCNSDVCLVFDYEKSNDKLCFNNKVKEIKCGNKNLIFLTKKDAYEQNLDSANYIEFEIDNKNLGNFLTKCNCLILKTDEVEKKKIYYGFSSLFDKYILIYNVKINIQIVEIDKKNYKVGYPLIYSSF